MFDILKNISITMESIQSELGWQASKDALEFRINDTAIPTTLPVADIASAIQAMRGLAAVEIHRRRTGDMQSLIVDRRGASLSMSSFGYLRVSGEILRESDPITGYYRCGDGRWVFLHCNFPHLRAQLLDFLDARDNPKSVADRVAQMSADAIEHGAGSRGLCAVKARSRSEWELHPQFSVLSSTPLVEVRRIGDAPVTPLRAGTGPLENIKVLDLTRVIAGPMAGRALAEHGATVLRVNSTNLPYMRQKSIDTGFGKYSSYIDLEQETGRRELGALVDDADIFIDGYRPGALGRHGFGVNDLRKRRPGIIAVSVSAYSEFGPWGGRRGYDSVLQALTGFCEVIGTSDRPKNLPFQPFDYTTGSLAAIGAMVALIRRSQEGGSWEVKVSLGGVANWFWQMCDRLAPESAPINDKPDASSIQEYYWTMPSSFGELRAIKPAFELSRTPVQWVRAPVVVGSDPARWPPEVRATNGAQNRRKL